MSYGKDSLACLAAIEKLGWPVDRIVHAEIWATDDIPADLPPMVEFKKKADAIIKDRWGIDVEHVTAMTTYEDVARKQRRSMDELNNHNMETGGAKPLTFQDVFYSLRQRGDRTGQTIGWPRTIGAWCNSELKMRALNRAMRCQEMVMGGGNSFQVHLREPVLPGVSEGPQDRADIWMAVPERTPMPERTEDERSPAGVHPVFSGSPSSRGAEKNSVIQYVGIAIDEPERLARLDGTNKISPLAALGWTEADCRKWCEENDLLSPIYTSSTRGGCWFCHNQGVEQLRLLRRNYPDLWALMLKWDADSPVTFKSGGRTVHDYDKRFLMEEAGLIDPDRRFLWKCVTEGDLSDVISNHS